MSKSTQKSREFISLISVLTMFSVLFIWLFLIQINDDPNTSAYATGGNPTPTPFPDDCWILAYVSAENPFGDFPGHAWVKVVRTGYGTDVPWNYNHQQWGWWPIDDSKWLVGDKGIWKDEPHNPIRTPNTIKGIYCNTGEAGNALLCMYYENITGNYWVASNNCTVTSKNVFQQGYDGVIPSTTSWWVFGFIQTPCAWRDWLEANIP